MERDIIDLIGGVHAGNAYLNFIEDTARKAESVVGLVAYWTLSAFDAPAFINLIGKNGSFICVDPSPPTDLEKLVSMNLAGNNFYAFQLELSSFEYKVGLLHSKMLLFDNHDDSAILVLGSHNMTIRAISGINIEHSIAIKLNKSDDLYRNVRNQIIAIKENLCDKVLFVPEDDPVDVLILVGENMDKLIDEGLISIFYKSAKEAIKSNERTIYILAIDAANSKEYLYESSVKQSGVLDPYIKKSTEIEFSDRRYAVKEKFSFPFLFDEIKIPTEELKQNQYFNMLKVERRINDYFLYTYILHNVDDKIVSFYGDNPFYEKLLNKIKLSKRILTNESIQQYKPTFNLAAVKARYVQSPDAVIQEKSAINVESSLPLHRSVLSKMYLKIL